MSNQAARVLERLQVVERLRQRRAADPDLARRVLAVKDYQARRFELTYADLLGSARYRPAALFFLEHLYGPREFADRDAQFARVVPAITRIFPTEVSLTVESLAELHALSEAMDTEMAGHVPMSRLQAQDYVAAWQATGRPADRERQIELTLDIGRALDHYTRSRFIRTTLRVMRRPAKAAGLAALQNFLESGFQAFAAMGGASEFLAWIDDREHALASTLFDPDALQSIKPGQRPTEAPLSAALNQLP
jgi:hypothetical protein